jgi:hypothetical protein
MRDEDVTIEIVNMDDQEIEDAREALIDESATE